MTHNDITVFSVIKNGIQNGYPFVEAYASWSNYCDKIFVLDGHSDDGTDIVLRELSRILPNFEFQRAPWPPLVPGGSSIAHFTNMCLSTVKKTADRLIYVQADEIFEKQTREKLSNYYGGAVELTQYILFWNSFYKIIRFENNKDTSRSTLWKAIKLFPSIADVTSIGDGLTFQIRDIPINQWNDEVFHYGWNFPVNILQKHASHVNLYSDNPQYQYRALHAGNFLKSRNYSRQDLEDLDPQYHDIARPFKGKHPDCVHHLLGMNFYDPYVGLTLLKNGVKW
jgi:hypothetical protein